MAMKGQLHLGGRHPAAVVGDADEPFAASTRLHPHVTRASVYRVLDQFLDYR